MEVITLAHGSGGAKTNELIGSLFKEAFDNDYLTSDDAALLDQLDGKVAMSTDGFIVSPAFFNGGNIGKLSICGSVNDIVCMGAIPQYLTCAFVIEEGFPIDDLKKIVYAMADTAKKAGIKIVAGDTKVAGKGQVDGVFITTTAIGRIMDGIETSGKYAKPDDVVIVTGDIGRHGSCILLERDDYGIDAHITSDCAPLSKPLLDVYENVKDVHVVRDATRGGVGTVLYEIANESNVGICINQTDIPVSDEVRGVTGMLGLDPLYLACEGRMVIVAHKDKATQIIDILSKYDDTKGATVIGKVTETHPTKVTMLTELKTEILLPPPGNELLPRIC